MAAILALALPLAYVIAAAQERLTFEAASVKPATTPPCLAIVDGTVAHLTGTGMDCSPYDNKGGPGTGDPGRIHIPVTPLRGLLKRAYQEYFDVKSPDWADNDVMALDATMPPNTTKEQFQKMLQNLLIDRFALKTHVETKEITGYVLTVAKDGPKFKESPLDNDPNAPFTDHKGTDGFPVRDPHMRGTAIMFASGERMRLTGPHATTTELSKQLGNLLDSVVEDRTGLKGAYDVTLNFAGQSGGHRGGSALQQPPAPSTDPGAPEPFPDIFSALQTQLGLKLEKQKVSVEIVVVDHMEKTPVGN